MQLLQILNSIQQQPIAPGCSWCTLLSTIRVKMGVECYKISINASLFTTVWQQREHCRVWAVISSVLYKNGQTNWRYYQNVYRYSPCSCSKTRCIHECCATSSFPEIGPLSRSKCVLMWIKVDLRGWVNGTLSSTVCAVPSLFMPMAKHFW